MHRPVPLLDPIKRERWLVKKPRNSNSLKDLELVAGGVFEPLTLRVRRPTE
jgi:hypothetical protein